MEIISFQNSFFKCLPFSILIGGVELTNLQWIYLIANICLIISIGIGLTVWKVIQSRQDDSNENTK